MDLDAKFYAGRFRELAERFEDRRAATDVAAAFEGLATMTAAGELFIEAVKCGYLESLGGARELIGEYERAKSQRDAGECVAFIGGRCIAMPPTAQAIRAICPANLFKDVAGGDAIQVVNDGGTLKPTRALPPSGLLPDEKPGMFPGAPFQLLRITAQGAEADDFARLAQGDTANRYALACRILAAVLESTTATAIKATLPAPRSAGKVNKRMEAALAANFNEVTGWTIRQWAAHLHCSIGAIAECSTWKDLQLLRAKAKAEKQSDRHRKSKASKQ